MQTRIGAMKFAANRAGLSFEEYQGKVSAGFKWCYKCRSWKPRLTDFCRDNNRGDGLCSLCVSCRTVPIRKSTKGRPSAFKGKHHTPETKQKMRDARKGKPGTRLGIKHTIETRKKISETVRRTAVRGVNCHAYKDGKSQERRGVRFSAEYHRWRFDVYSRDLCRCQDCGDSTGGNLCAHHLLGFAEYPDLRFDVSNGITLCRTCHKNRHRAQ